MSDMLSKIGIDWRLFLAQLLNFLLLFFLLRTFAWKPLLNALQERRNRIKKGLTDAEAAETARRSADADREKLLSETRKEGAELIEEARKAGESVREKKIQMARKEVDRFVADAEDRIGREQDEAWQNLRGRAADLVTEASKKLIPQLDASAHQSLIRDALRELDRS